MIVSVPNNVDFCISNKKFEDCPHSLYQAEEQGLLRPFPHVYGEELHCVRGGKSPESRHTEWRVVRTCINPESEDRFIQLWEKSKLKRQFTEEEILFSISLLTKQNQYFHQSDWQKKEL